VNCFRETSDDRFQFRRSDQIQTTTLYPGIHALGTCTRYSSLNLSHMNTHGKNGCVSGMIERQYPEER